jgi:hypothetical protein
MTLTDAPLPHRGQDDDGVLAWLMSVAEQTRPADDVAPAVIPVAWMGRTSTDDQQDPTLSLPRQLEALPGGVAGPVRDRGQVLRRGVRP